MKSLFLIFVFIAFAHKSLLAQDKFPIEKATIKILSENQVLHIDSGVLKHIFESKYREKLLTIQNNFKNVIKDEIKSVTGQSTRDEEVNLQMWSLLVNISEEEKALYINFTIPYNNIKLHITTPDNELGFGKHRKYDPTLHLEFETTISIPLVQQGVASSIEFLNPSYTFKIRDYRITYYDKDDVDKKKIQQWIKYTMPFAFQKVYYTMDDLKVNLNHYLETKIKGNEKLKKEWAIDENTELEVKKQGDLTLLFRHRYSSKGIVKRTSTNDASKILEEPVKTAPTVSVSNSPEQIGSRPSSASPSSNLPVSTSPAGINKGPSSIPKSTPVIKKKQ